jgi:hypothetical protein
MADDEAKLIDFEHRLIATSANDRRVLEIAQKTGLKPEDLRKPYWINAYRHAIANPPDAKTHFLVESHYLGLALKLKHAAPNRPAWVEPPPKQHVEQHAVPQRTAPTDKPKKRKPPSKEFLGKRRNMRTAELKVLARYLPRAELNAIVAAFPGRDVYDPEDVDRREIGEHVKLTEDEMFKIEQSATDHGLQRKWGRPGRPYRFSFRTITCYDLTDEAVRLDRKDRSDKRTKQRLKSERLEKKTMTATATTATATARPKTLADIMAEQKARTRAQCDALYDVLAKDGEWHEIVPLVDAVRRHPAWRDVADAKRRQTVVTRLDMLRDKGRIEDDYKPGPRGSFRRLVRLKNRRHDRSTA